MRLFQSVSFRVVLTCVLAIASIFAWRVTVDGEDQARQLAAPQFVTQSSAVPDKYADIYARLNRRVTISFDKTPREEAFAFLEEKLAKPISVEIDLSAVEHVTLQSPHPITIKKALRQMIGWGAPQIALGENEIVVTRAENIKDRYALQAHDLRIVSSYSTKMRDQLIAEIKREVTPDAWGKEDGPWITPGTSVFTIDVCHTPQAQTQITEALQKKYGQPYYGLFGFGPFNPDREKPTPEELVKKAKTLRTEYPFESLAPRLAYEEGKAAKPSALSPAAQKSLHEKDEHHDAIRKSKHAWGNLRRAALVELHGSEVQKFVAREGFGFARMPSPTPSNLELPPIPQLALPSAEIDPPQGDPIARVPNSAAEAAGAVSDLPTNVKLSGLHANSESIFLEKGRMGYAKDVDNVAGFSAHAFSRLPRLSEQDSWYAEPQEHWAMRRMELVSLLKHDKPQVYVSDELPRLDKEGKTPVRDLGGFEADALTKLQAGEDVVTHATLNRIHMLGALRASKACLECHSVEHGQLLGAFSYTLVRDPLIKAKDAAVH